jgi:4-hydroxy-4-methyl-2-oxoglutarate aldolase
MEKGEKNDFERQMVIGKTMPQWIISEFERPSIEVLKQFEAIPTSILSDCMNRFQSMESSNWEAHQALAMAKAGDVLVIAARGGMNNAVWGHVMTFAARQRGLAGVIVDGCIRDGAENKADTLPIYCRGITSAGPHMGWQGNINVPVACAGVVVNAGDILVGDDDGIVVIPLAKAEEVLAEAKERMTGEAAWYKRLEAGETTVEILGLKKGK